MHAPAPTQDRRRRPRSTPSLPPHRRYVVCSKPDGGPRLPRGSRCSKEPQPDTLGRAGWRRCKQGSGDIQERRGNQDPPLVAAHGRPLRQASRGSAGASLLPVARPTPASNDGSLGSKAPQLSRRSDIGPSGSGKSNLLRRLNLLEHPTSGEKYGPTTTSRALIRGSSIRSTSKVAVVASA